MTNVQKLQSAFRGTIPKDLLYKLDEIIRAANSNSDDADALLASNAYGYSDSAELSKGLDALTVLIQSLPEAKSYDGVIEEIRHIALSLPFPKDYDNSISDLAEMPYLEPYERSYQKEIEELRAVVMMNLPTVEPKYVLSDAKQYFYAGF